MDYSQSVEFHGDVNRAIEYATLILTTLGFRLVAQDESSAEFEGPGMNNTRQPGLLGVSYLRIAADGATLMIEAELGGVRKMERFVTWFPTSLGVFLGLTLGGLAWQFAGWKMATTIFTTAALSVLPWKIIAPIFVRRIRTRTTPALDTLLGNLASISSDRYVT
jgi:hypothetical protein